MVFSLFIFSGRRSRQQWPPSPQRPPSATTITMSLAQVQGRFGLNLMHTRAVAAVAAAATPGYYDYDVLGSSAGAVRPQHQAYKPQLAAVAAGITSDTFDMSHLFKGALALGIPPNSRVQRRSIRSLVLGIPLKYMRWMFLGAKAFNQEVG